MEAGSELMITPDLARRNPVVTLTAIWESEWDILSFMVEGEKYCEALVSRYHPVVQYPKEPILASNKFIGWDKGNGEWLSGIERS